MNDAPKPIRVILADDHPIVRAGIRAELETVPRVQVLAEASDGREAVELVKAQQPDLVLMDISMPSLNGLEALARITRDAPQTRVLILSRHDSEEYFWHALKAGACGYLLKKATVAELRTAVERVAEGKIFLSQELSNRFLKNHPWEQTSRQRTPLDDLTERQREILQLIAEGQTTKAIALILKVSPKTVEYHRMQLMDRLKIHDIPGLVRFALRTGVISQES